MSSQPLSFANDYLALAHPRILDRLVETNLQAASGYGTDEWTLSAVERIRKACASPQAEVRFLSGGTQTNQVVISSLLKPYQGVLAAASGHISVHEAGAIEITGHKIMELPTADGKLSADQVEQTLSAYWQDGNHEHMVMPGMVYISQPTEFGTLYSKAELEALFQVCQSYHIPLFVDGARLAYALAAPENDVTLADLARLTDVFYIGGTKCGAMLGEAIVVPDPHLIPHFTSLIKQRGALLAKGRLLGIQFDELFRDDLYLTIASDAIAYANQIRACLRENGYRLYLDSPTNQIFCILENQEMEALAKKVAFSFWEAYDEQHTVVRLATSWSSTQEEVTALCEMLQDTH